MTSPSPTSFSRQSSTSSSAVGSGNNNNNNTNKISNNTNQKSKLSAQDLKTFYFSKSSNFGTFQSRQQQDANISAARRNNHNTNNNAVGSAVKAIRSHLDQNAIPSNNSDSNNDDYYQGDDGISSDHDHTTINNNNDNHNRQQQHQISRRPPSASAPSAPTNPNQGLNNRIDSLRQQQQATSSQITNNNNNSVMRRSAGVAGGDGVSSSYLSFLHDQQQILKTHQYVKSTVDSVIAAIAEHRDHFASLTADCDKLLHSAELSSDWNWKSRFTRDQLVLDAALDVPFDDLLKQEDIPNIAALQHLLQNMHKLRHELAGVARQQALLDGDKNNNNNNENNNNNNGTSRFQPFFALLEQGTRKVERFISEFGQSNIDATPIAKLPDTLLVQMDNSLRLPPLSRVLEESLLRLEGLESKRQECIQIREQAIEEGNMDIAERQSFALADLSEECTATIQEKLKILKRVAEDHGVLQRVCASYSQGFVEAVEVLEVASAEKKKRCEDDLGRLFTLKRKMEDVERTLRERWEKSKITSDDKLRQIDQDQSKIWVELLELTTKFAALEEVRHAECKRRVEEKAAEEGRRNDYDVFVTAVGEYAKSLERTVTNMELKFQSTQIMADFVRGGFSAIQKDIVNLKSAVEVELVEAHRSHLGAFRNLLFILGELEYRKERKIEEVGVQIQNAHIQLELCSDSLNIQAKRFADERNDLTKRLHVIEHDVEKLRERQATALELFAPSWATLQSAGYDHEHPMSELQEWKLDTRAKMVDYRAVAVGGGARSKNLRANLSSLAQSLEESRSRIFHHGRQQQQQQMEGMNQSHQNNSNNNYSGRY